MNEHLFMYICNVLFIFSIRDSMRCVNVVFCLGKSVLRVCDGIRKVTGEASGLVHVDRLRCTELRKYLATATQVN